MSYKPHELPESTRRLMSKEDRKSLGVQTSAEADATFVAKSEKEMHEKFAQWCSLHGVIAIHGRMDKRSTLKKGVSDFIVLKNGRGACFDFKMPGNDPTVEQYDFYSNCQREKVPCVFVYDLSSAIAFVKEALKI